jgi:hypothetical protein
MTSDGAMPTIHVGYYNITSSLNNVTKQYYCEMDLAAGGWTEIFRRWTNNNSCPNGFQNDVDNVCDFSCSSGCTVSSTFSAPFAFAEVLGQVTLAFKGSPDGFHTSCAFPEGVSVSAGGQTVFDFAMDANACPCDNDQWENVNFDRSQVISRSACGVTEHVHACRPRIFTMQSIQGLLAMPYNNPTAAAGCTRSRATTRALAVMPVSARRGSNRPWRMAARLRSRWRSVCVRAGTLGVTSCARRRVVTKARRTSRSALTVRDCSCVRR